jgi:curved DNA-binding protein CbpA
MAKDYYAILDVPRTATAEQVRARFRELARSRHPDRFQGDEKATAEVEFQAITEAFNVLSDPEKRRVLDSELLRPDVTVARGPDAGQLAKIYLQRGIKAYREKNFVEAADNFDRATKAEPSNAQAWHHLALACSQTPRFQSRSLDAIAHAVKLDKMNDTYLKMAGKLYAAAGMTTKAEQYYNEALTWGGEDPAIREALEELRKPKKTKPGLFGRTGS